MKRLQAAIGMSVAALQWHGVAGEPDWGKAQNDVTTLLFASNMPIAELVGTVRHGSVSDGNAALFKVCVLLRAGLETQAVAALGELKAVCPELGSFQVAGIYHDACDREEAWDVAQAVAETFAGIVTDLSLENRLLKHWLESGWSVERIDAWLAARPRGVQSFWLKERLRFARNHGRGEVLLRELSEEVRRNPADISNAIAFLDALLYARQGEERIDMSWFGEVVTPTRAVDARSLAERFQRLNQEEIALSYGRRAIAAPLTEPEVRELGRTIQAVLSAEAIRASFGVSVREMMAENLLKLGRADEAQKWLEEAVAIRAEHGLSLNARLAGRVQAGSGDRVIERRITESEATSKDDPRYWRERAMYYHGRREFELEEEALRKGLAVSAPRDSPEYPGKGQGDLRSGLLSDYARFLADRDRKGEAVELLRQEIANVPASAESSVRAAALLAMDHYLELKANDDVLWAWLAGRPKWSHPEERLLWRMLEGAPGVELERSIARAEALALDQDASRAYTLGWILNRMDRANRSVPWLERAAATAKDGELKERATFALLESLLDTGEWKRAESLFPEASGRLTALEIPEWLARLATVAAGQGAKAEALRIWARAANVRPSMKQSLTALARLGLREELITFYESMRQVLPGSRAPAGALALLEVE